MMKKIGLNYSLLVLTVIVIIALFFFLRIVYVNYYVYAIVSSIFLYLSMHFAVYYYVVYDDKIVKIYPCRLFNSKLVLKINDINYIEIRALYAPALNIIFFYNRHENKKGVDYMSCHSLSDLETILDALSKLNLKFVINVRKDFTAQRKVIRKCLKNNLSSSELKEI
jgi:hypothetical protein